MNNTVLNILEDRKPYVVTKSASIASLQCDKKSIAGSVSQRACVFCGSRVVLYPVCNALHLVHGPIGCAAYTWDIRGSQSNQSQLNRMSFSTDLREMDVIYGGERKLENVLYELIEKYNPKAAFVYATCIVGVIGDDVASVCKKVEEKTGIQVIPVHSEGFKGTKKDGYNAACNAISKVIGTGDTSCIGKYSINILGEFNLAGEAWIIKDYYEKMGVEVVSTITGGSTVEQIARAHGAKLNVVQCSGSMTGLAKIMKEKYGIPFIRVSYFGIEDMSKALYDVADFFKSRNPQIYENTEKLVAGEVRSTVNEIMNYKKVLGGKKAAIYVGGAFKAFSLIKALRLLNMQVVVVGSQTGNKDDYKLLQEMCDEGTVIVDDSNPVELSKFIIEKEADVFIGGVKERPMALKLGVAFCDHNHERKIPLAGYIGMLNFAKEVYSSIMSPVWKFAKRRKFLI
ncbi:MAG: nitrogenase iron-molybdenum cofactor biosynthesis protein NifE [Ignavibacteria bacterium]|jgi:nitrogenase molybdenum-cofactor synthesis protein NifE